MVTFKTLEFQVEPDAEMTRRAAAFHDAMARRRTVRDFSPEPVPRQLVEDAIRTAGTAPSGANLQPWHFVAIGRDDAALRPRLREEAEAEERAFYERRAPKAWLDALAPRGCSLPYCTRQDSPR